MPKKPKTKPLDAGKTIEAAKKKVLKLIKEREALTDKLIEAGQAYIKLVNIRKTFGESTK